MDCKKVDLYEYFGIKKEEKMECTLDCTLHVASSYYADRVRPAMIVAAGGGYSGICEREGEPVAAGFLGKGYNIFVLRYSVAPHHYPVQLINGAMAVAYVRKNAKELRIDPDAIGFAGFSAAGHLAGMMATLTGEPEVKEALGEDAALAKPNAVIMGYPVISNGEYAHRGSMDNISGHDPELAEKLSLEKRVTADSVPAFIWGTADDKLVPAQNALFMACAYKMAGVPFELHMYETGPHGLGLATRPTAAHRGILTYLEDYVRPAVATWFEMAITFLENRNFTVKD